MDVLQFNALGVVPVELQVQKILDHLSHTHSAQSITIMVHGYLFNYGDKIHCPHSTLFHPNKIKDTFRTRSWPYELKPFANGNIAIGFSWPSRSRLKKAYRTAQIAASELAQLIKRIRYSNPKIRINVMAHSLGARVVFEAFHHLAPGDIKRIILLYPAEYKIPAEKALDTHLGRNAEILYVTSNENLIFEWFFSMCRLAGISAGPAFGIYEPDRFNVAKIDFTNKNLIFALRKHDICIGRKGRFTCHWSAYTRKGIFQLYAAWLFNPDRVSLFDLQKIIAECEINVPSQSSESRLPA